MIFAFCISIIAFSQASSQGLDNINIHQHSFHDKRGFTMAINISQHSSHDEPGFTMAPRYEPLSQGPIFPSCISLTKTLILFLFFIFCLPRVPALLTTVSSPSSFSYYYCYCYSSHCFHYQEKSGHLVPRMQFQTFQSWLHSGTTRRTLPRWVPHPCLHHLGPYHPSVLRYSPCHYSALPCWHWHERLPCECSPGISFPGKNRNSNIKARTSLPAFMFYKRETSVCKQSRARVFTPLHVFVDHSIWHLRFKKPYIYTCCNYN